MDMPALLLAQEISAGAHHKRSSLQNTLRKEQVSTGKKSKQALEVSASTDGESHARHGATFALPAAGVA
jgi:hypothetical protein